MQIENHKEEVPFEHYQGLFEKKTAAEMAARTGAKWEDGKFYVNLLGVEYAISHPKYSIALGERISPLPPVGRNDRDVSIGQVNIPLPAQTFLLRWLLEGKTVAWQGGWKTFREMPWGELYIKPYTGRVLTRAAFTFGTKVAAFRAACEKMGGLPLNHGDAGYQLELLPGFSMQIMVWEGDDEFPPNAQILYSDNFETAFAPEDRVVAGDLLISAIKGNM